MLAHPVLVQFSHISGYCTYINLTCHRRKLLKYQIRLQSRYRRNTWFVLPITQESHRLQQLAVGKRMFSRTALSPSASAVLQPLKCTNYLLFCTDTPVFRKLGNSIDVIKKPTVSRGTKKCLFSFPGLFSPATAGATIGELKGLDTNNPVMYLDFPAGRLKIRGTLVFPKNKYLTLCLSSSMFVLSGWCALS